MSGQNIVRKGLDTFLTSGAWKPSSVFKEHQPPNLLINLATQPTSPPSPVVEPQGSNNHRQGEQTLNIKFDCNVYVDKKTTFLAHM